MLNESYELSTSIQNARIKVQSWHKDYKNCPNYKTFFLLVSKDSGICVLKPIYDRSKIQSIRKYECANGISFPAFNILPLLHAKSSEGLDNLKKLKEILKEKSSVEKAELNNLIDCLWKTCDHLWDDKEFRRIGKCLKTAGLQEKLANFTVPEEYGAITELIKRSIIISASVLKESVKRLIPDYIIKFPGNAEEFINTILVSTSKKSIKKVSIILELEDSSAFPFPATNQKVQVWVNQYLLTLEQQEEAKNEFDAFGLPMNEMDSQKKFPEVKLPRLGKVQLRAMSAEIPCQKRYGQIDAKSFPAGSKVRQSMKDSLEWLGHENRKGKTWEDITGVIGDKSTLLFAYPSFLSEDPPELTPLFAGKVKSEDPDGAKFESAAARVIPALKGIVREHPNTEIIIFILSKADKARTKIIVSRHYTARQLISGAQVWQDGCQNIPEIKLNCGTKDKPQWIEPFIPFPNDVVKCLSTTWLQNGLRAEKVQGILIEQGISLLLEKDHELQRIIERALHLASTNTTSLFLALGHADHRKDGSLKIDNRHFWQANILPSILGLLLFKINILKGEYMHTAPFLVGRLLALADLLHKEYCKHVRKSETPPQLIGNALMSTAIENPERGLARLCERLMPYQAWTNKAKGEDSALAKWTLNQMEKTSSELSKIKLPNSSSDADKAQILLGYLARFESKNSNDSDNITTISN